MIKQIKKDFVKTVSYVKRFLYDVAFRKIFYIPLILMTTLSYGFTLFNRTMFIDDMAQSLYYGDENLKLRSLRWGQFLINRIFSNIEFSPFINKFFGVFF